MDYEKILKKIGKMKERRIIVIVDPRQQVPARSDHRRGSGVLTAWAETIIDLRDGEFKIIKDKDGLRS